MPSSRTILRRRFFVISHIWALISALALFTLCSLLLIEVTNPLMQDPIDAEQPDMRDQLNYYLALEDALLALLVCLMCYRMLQIYLDWSEDLKGHGTRITSWCIHVCSAWLAWLGLGFRRCFARDATVQAAGGNVRWDVEGERARIESALATCLRAPPPAAAMATQSKLSARTRPSEATRESFTAFMPPSAAPGLSAGALRTLCPCWDPSYLSRRNASGITTVLHVLEAGLLLALVWVWLHGSSHEVRLVGALSLLLPRAGRVLVFLAAANASPSLERDLLLECRRCEGLPYRQLVDLLAFLVAGYACNGWLSPSHPGLAAPWSCPGSLCSDALCSDASLTPWALCA